MRKSIGLFIVLAVILSGCGSSKKQLEKGNYDQAIATAVKELRRNPDDSKQIATLESSYQIVTEQDNERIRFLKMEGKAQSWDEIYLIYKRMNDRQAMVRSIAPLTGGKVNVSNIDYMPEMVAAKKKAADFYYAHGVELMKTNIKDNFRQAFYEFVRAKEYVGDYEGIDAKIQESKYLGMSRVFVSVQNTSILKFPREFEQDLLALDLPNLNSEWVDYHIVNLGADTKYDYFININVKNVLVSPDQTAQRDSVIKREVEDGFSYQLDKKGNVMRDSLGNDIKIKKYKTLQCALVSTLQTKTCRIEGDIEIVQVSPNKLLKKEPLGAQSTFENVSARALGDVGALSPSQLARTKSQIVPFPTDIDMVIRCSESLKMAIRTAVQINRRMII
jgi:hypothetical protein